MQIAKWIIAFISIVNVGGFVADALVSVRAKQHLWDPRWPPPAKFHNGQTMLMGIFGGSISLVMLFGFHALRLPMFLIAAETAANYFVAMILAPLFRGTNWADPEFKAKTGRPLSLAPEQLISYVIYGIVLCSAELIRRWAQFIVPIPSTSHVSTTALLEGDHKDACNER